METQNRLFFFRFFSRLLKRWLVQGCMAICYFPNRITEKAGGSPTRGVTERKVGVWCVSTWSLHWVTGANWGKVKMYKCYLNFGSCANRHVSFKRLYFNTSPFLHYHYGTSRSHQQIQNFCLHPVHLYIIHHYVICLLFISNVSLFCQPHCKCSLLKSRSFDLKYEMGWRAVGILV